VVQFLHEADPERWARVQGSLRAFADQCESGRVVSAGDLARGVRNLREVSGRHAAKLDALRRAASLSQERGIGELPVLVRRLALAARLAAQLPELFGRGVRMLVRGQTAQVFLTRRQCWALLAAALFGALPEDWVQGEAGGSGGRALDLPSFDFSSLLEKEEEKVLCLLSYFSQVATAGEAELEEVVSFGRRAEDPLGEDFWSGLDKPLAAARVCDDGTLIEVSRGNLQADFANKYLGGAVLSHGAVQEEIRFMICPECLISMLFCEVMLPNEAVFIVGTRQYSRYGGYGHSFHFDGPHLPDPDAPADERGRRGPHIVAFDALDLPHTRQYEPECILRELLKAYVACLGDPSEDAGDRQVGFATGNWGCGVFGGDPQLKALIQWLAASAAGRELVYHPFGDRRVAKLAEVIEAVRSSGLRCRDLFAVLQGHAPGEVFAGVLEQVRSTTPSGEGPSPSGRDPSQ